MNLYRWPEFTDCAWDDPCFIIAMGETVDDARKNAIKAFYPYKRYFDAKFTVWRTHDVSERKALVDLSEENLLEYRREFAEFKERIAGEPEIVGCGAVLIHAEEGARN